MPIVLHMEHPNVLKAEARGDYRRRCQICGQLTCQKCRACNGHHEGNYSDARAVYGRISTDKAGRTLHRECRYYIDELDL